MLVVTTDALPGYDIREVLGEVIGVTARTHNPFAEGVRSLHGGTNPRMMEILTGWREDAVERMAENALRRGANAVVGMRFDHRDITSSWVEICAYGTAVVVSLRVTVPRTVPAGPASNQPSIPAGPASNQPSTPAGGSGGNQPATVLDRPATARTQNENRTGDRPGPRHAR